MTTVGMVQMTLELWGGFFCIICGLYILVGQKLESKRCLLMMLFLFLQAIQLFSDAAAWRFRGDPTTLGWYMVRISNYLVFIFHFIPPIVAVNYIGQFLENYQRKINKCWTYAIYGICFFGIIVVTVSQFSDYIYKFDENNYYQRSDGFLLISVMAVILLVLLVFLTLRYRKYMKEIQFVPLMCVYLFPLTADVIQAFHYGISFASIAMMFGVIVMFLFYEVERSQILVEQQNLLLKHELELAKQQNELTQRKAELTEERTKIMLSQIKPHFLYNTLGSIEVLCDRDPKQAKKAIHQFAKYMRMNMGSMEKVTLVSFPIELDYTRTYLWIEQMRFQEDLNIKYDLQTEDFRIPSLTLQPIVENAVRHGIGQKVGGGTVTIATRKEQDEILIQVTDTGIGFDSEKPPADGKIHVGIENVTKRLKLLCNGTVSIESVPGTGTTVTLRIPSV